MDEKSSSHRPAPRDHWTKPYRRKHRRKRSTFLRSRSLRTRNADLRTIRRTRCSTRSPCISCRRKAFFSSLHRGRTTLTILRALKLAAQRSKRNADDTRPLEHAIMTNGLSSSRFIAKGAGSSLPEETLTDQIIRGRSQSQSIVAKSPLLNGVLGSSSMVANDRIPSNPLAHAHDSKIVSRKRALSPNTGGSKGIKTARIGSVTYSERNGTLEKPQSKVSKDAGMAPPTEKAQHQTRKVASSGAATKPESAEGAKSITNGMTKDEQSKQSSHQKNAATQQKPATAQVKGKMDAVSLKLSRWPASLKNPRRQGLENPGAWCYRRAMLQCFLSTPHFYNVVTHRQNSNCSPQCVPCALRTFTESYHRDGSQARLNLKKLDQCTRMQPGKGCPRWSSNGVHNQEDAHEYMLYLLNSLDATKCIQYGSLRHFHPPNID